MTQLGTTYLREVAVMGPKGRLDITTSLDGGLSTGCAVDARQWSSYREAIRRYYDNWYGTTEGLYTRSLLKIDPGIGFPIQIPYLHNLHRGRIESGTAGSRIWTHTAVVGLIQGTPGVQGSRITGAIVRHQTPGSPPVCYEVRAKMVVLATGGFQGSPGLTATYLGQGGDNIFVRSNPGSVGDGLSLATAAGAGTSRGMNTYYGHLLAAPVRAEDVDPKDYLPLAQYRKLSPVSFLFRLNLTPL